ncbi:nose resistant to fluoxetine protein 6-like [Gigantopelta aegis]|uniref:nose resistant to fluoxetine protein 6-like n=1 Tax=Gigantopelta aegis TaxID=1735272 RepID=UPI001B88D9D9|nr:nose resistant to fluoxetine protein 6-like [Gigantopelta aegis]
MYLSLVLGFILITNIYEVSCQNGQDEQSMYWSLLQNIKNLANTDTERELAISNIEELKDRSLQLMDIANWHKFYNARSFASSLASRNVSQKCANQTGEFLVEIPLNFKAKWVQQMVDAAGKPGSGLLLGNMIWPGAFKECLGVRAEIYYNRSHSASTKPDDTFSGRHCLAKIPLKKPNPGMQFMFIGIQWGACFPDSCSADDVTQILNNVLDDIGTNITKGLQVWHTECNLDDRRLDTKATVVLVIAMLFVAVMLIGTFLDVVFVQMPMRARLSVETEGLTSHLVKDGDIISHINASKGVSENESSPLLGEKKQHAGPSVCVKVFLAFSVYTNAKKLLNTSQPKGTLTAIHGIRFISMTWVILGHCMVFGLGVVDNILEFGQELKRFTFQCIINGTVSVDTFFTLSGLLVAYLTFKEMKRVKKGLKLNWLMFYFHRFWRLTPPYMLLMMVYVPLMPYISSGPMWPQAGFELNQCEGTWWTNLLYINNIVKKNQMCMGWSWYLANDMQFYVLSPLILIPFYYSKFLGIMMSMLFLLTSLITTGIISRVDHIGVGLGVDVNNLQNSTNNPNTAFDAIYMVPWCRMGPYIIGIWTGYILYRTDCRIRMSRVTVIFGWAIATASALAVVYGLYDVNNGHPLAVDTAAFYNSVNRTVWGACVCWVVLACATGYGGYVNTLLSWKGIIPLSRLTYCAYLLHPIIMFYYYYSRETTFHLSDINLLFSFFSFLVASYGVSFIVSLAFEAPMMGLEKVFFKREKNS